MRGPQVVTKKQEQAAEWEKIWDSKVKKLRAQRAEVKNRRTAMVEQLRSDPEFLQNAKDAGGRKLVGRRSPLGQPFTNPGRKRSRGPLACQGKQRNLTRHTHQFHAKSACQRRGLTRSTLLA